MRALELLYYLGALDTKFNLTPLGAVIAQFPLDPQVSGSTSRELRSLTFNIDVPASSSRSF